MIHRQNNLEYKFELALLRQFTNKKKLNVFNPKAEGRQKSFFLDRAQLGYNQNRFTQILTRMHTRSRKHFNHFKS